MIHHTPGVDSATKATGRRFDTVGYNAICFNHHIREVPWGLS